MNNTNKTIKYVLIINNIIFMISFLELFHIFEYNLNIQHIIRRIAPINIKIDFLIFHIINKSICSNMCIIE